MLQTRPTTHKLNFGWLLRMAWRDSRRNRTRLFLFGSPVVLGIAALVSIYSLSENLRRNVDAQAASLIGADLQLSGNKPASPAIRHIIDSVSDSQSEEKRFASMIFFPSSAGTRLVQIRALEGDFPYYGKLETAPATGALSFRNYRAALVDQALMLQYGASVGDSVKIGDLSFVIEASLLKAPGQTGLSASVAPVVYIPLRYLAATGLLQKGSRINHTYYIRFAPGIHATTLIPRIEPRLDLEGWNYETIETRKQETGRAFADFQHFLELVAFVALLLGCTAVAGAIHVYVREKINTVALLRCMGASSSQAFLIFLIQIVGMGAACAVAGAALGALLQQFLPVILKDFIPVEISTRISWQSIGQGIATGILVAVLFALLPLIAVRNITPLHTLRLSFQQEPQKRDFLKWLIYLLILLFMYSLVQLQFGDWQRSAVFIGGVILGLLVLSGTAGLLMWLVRRFFSAIPGYVWRQGLSNLYRPNNQTVLLIVVIGFGAAFLSTLFFVQTLLINRVMLTASDDQPNIVLFDIQTSQQDALLQLARDHGLPVKPTVPIVNMRLEEWNGMAASEVQEDTTAPVRMRLFSREYRVTYRDSLTPYEKITAGEWSGKPDADGTIRISLEQGFASRQRIRLGDTLLFNVQGVLMPTVIGSLREVDWNRVQTNFLVVFPTGVLEQAPQFHVLLTRVPSPEISAGFQQDVVRQFPNVSIIDLALVLRVIEDLMAKIAFAIRFIAAFSMLTGLIVLVASILISRYQRVRETALLRTLGASSKQLLLISAVEYFFLGALAAATGIILSLVACYALARFTFESSFQPSLLPMILIFISVCCLTIFIGLLNNRGVLRRSPMEALRKE